MRGKKLGASYSRQRQLVLVIRSILNPLTLTASLTGLSLLSAAAFAEPTGGNIVGGIGAINQSGLTTTIQQNSAALAINWTSFNLDQNDIVNFIQPSASSIALNRILSSNGSQIHGQINANGQVILVNPNGIFFGATSSVNVGGLIASGLDINTDDFMNGHYQFHSIENTAGVVSNIGFIKAATGGSVALLGKQVKNEGVIVANLGAVNLAAGHEAVVTFDDAGYVGIKVTKEILQSELGIDPAIFNSGDITANGGRILLTASQSQDLFAQAVNTGAINQATSLVMHEDGSFTLGRGANVSNSGTLDVSTTEHNQNAGQVVVLGENVTSSGHIIADAQYANGGDIELHATDTTLLTENSVTSARAEQNGVGGVIKVLGDKVGVFDHSVVDASGELGGGELYIGGGFQGGNTLLRNAQFSYVNKDAALLADAGEQGGGGQVIVWANGSTQYYGVISARGGSQLGDGGFAEVSGKQGLIFDGDVDLSASAGDNGTLLLDPKNISITDQATTVGTTFPGDYNDFADLSSTDTLLNVTALNNRLNGASVVLSANTDIDVEASITTTSAYNLTLNAGRGITLGDDVTISLNGGNFTATINNESAWSGTYWDGTAFVPYRETGLANFTMGDSSSITTNGGAISITTGSFGGGSDVGNISLQILNSSGSPGRNAGNISISNPYGDVTANGAITATGGTASGNNAGFNGGDVNVSGRNVTLNTLNLNAVNTSGSNASGTLDNNGGTGGNITVDVSENGGTPSIVLNGNLITAGGSAANDADLLNGVGTNGTAGVVAISLNGTNASGNATINYDGTFSSGFTVTNNTTGANRFIQAAIRDNSWSYGANVSLNGASFTGFNVLEGNSDVDTLTRVSSSSSTNTWTIDTDNGGSVGGVTFSGMENLTGGNGVDVFNLGANISDTVSGGSGDDVFNIMAAGVLIGDIDGGGGTDTLAVSASVSAANTWNITSNNRGTLNTNTTFSDIENLTGGGGMDTFNLGDDVSGTVRGGAGNDVFNITANSVSLRLEGGAGVDTLHGFNRINTWAIANNAGTLNNAIIFSQMEILTGNINQDRFTFNNSSANFSGLIDGGTAGDLDMNGVEDVIDTVNYSNISNAVNVRLGLDIVNIESITGNGASSTLVGTNAGHAWNITGANSGNVDNQLSFTSFNNLTGGTGDDNFAFENDTSRINGSINGGGGTGVDTADYSQLSNYTVNLGSSLNGIIGIESVQGDNVNATLVADDELNAWTVTALNSGAVQNINGPVAFSGFNHLTGGNQADTFTVNSGGHVTGLIRGMAGDDIVTIGFSGTETGQIYFNGGDNDDSIELTGGSADYAVTYDSNVSGADQLTYNANGNIYTVRYLNTENIDDAVTATSLSINGTTGNDAIVLGNGQFRVNTSAAVASSNKANLIVDALAGIDTLNLSGNMTFSEGVSLTVETLTNSSGVLSADSLLLNNVVNVGTVANRFNTQVDQLYLQNISGAVYLNEADALTLGQAQLDAAITLNVQAGGDITQAAALSTAANVTLVSGSNILLDAPANNLTGMLSLTGNNVTLYNLADTLLSNVTAQTLNVNATGNITDVDGAVITVTGASDLTAGGDIVLDGINGVSTHQFGDVSASARNVTLAAADISVNVITAESLIALQSNTDITDTNGASTNLIADRVQLSAQSGISVDTETSALNVVNASSGLVDIQNTNTVLLELLQNAGGAVIFVNRGTVNIDRIEANGLLTMRVANGDFRGVGLTPEYTEEAADIVAGSADFLALGGSFGTRLRPIVAYIPGNVTLLSRISYSPIFLPAEPSTRIADTSLLKFSALDTLSSLAGEQVVEVENPDDVDPAIFTAVHNYNLSDISIRMPKDQIFEEEM